MIELFLNYIIMHKFGCWVTSLLLIIGGLNWGLDGIGGFMDKNLNVVNMLLGQWPTVEYIVYILVALSALIMLYTFFAHANCCACHCEEKPMTEEKPEM